MATTRFGLRGIMERPAGSFAGKAADAGHGPHNPGTITRFALFGIMTRLAGSFAGKTPALGGGGVVFRPIIRPRKR